MKLMVIISQKKLSDKKFKKNSNLKRLANTEIMEIWQIKTTKFYYLCKKNED